jgi:hypothetical protein
MPKLGKKIPTLGTRVGHKRSDMRWLAPDGVEWSSKFEYEVYAAAKLAGVRVRKCQRGKPGESGSDTFEYGHSPGRGLKCRVCGSDQVSQSRSYTPDLLHDPEVLPARSEQVYSPGRSEHYYVDVKGYMRANKRSLLRSFCKARQDIALRVILQRDYRLSKTATISQWLSKTLRVPYVLWAGRWPASQDWIMPNEPKASKKAKKGPKDIAGQLQAKD